MSDLSKMQEKASDPNTPLTTLQAIAQDYPALRPALALNPSAYPDLLDWLRSLGDPEIDNALAKRAEAEKILQKMSVSPDKVGSEKTATETTSPESKPTQSVKPGSTLGSTGKALKPAKPASHFAQPVTTTDETEKAEELSPAAIAAAGLATTGGELTSLAANATNESPDVAAVTTAAGTTAAAGTSFTPVAGGNQGSHSSFFSQGDSTGESGKAAPARKPSRTLMWILLGILAVILIVIVIVVNVKGKSPENTASIPAEDPMPITTGTTGATPNESSAKPSGISPVPSLPAGYTGPTKTIEVPGPTPGETLLVVVPDTDAPSPSVTPNADASSAPAQPKNLLAPPDTAKPVQSFTTADGNIRCVFGDTQVQCFANVLNAATNCENRQVDTGYTLTLSSANTLQADCAAPQTTATEIALGASEVATNGGFACKNSSNGGTVMCWDTKDGDGFILGKSNLSRFNTGDKLPAFQ